MPKSTIDVEDFLATARKRFTHAMRAEADDVKEAKEDVAFVAGEQWADKARKRREKRNRPVLCWNRLQTFVAQVVNDGRENKPAIKVSPLDGGSKETAEVFQDRIRHLEYESDADIAYDTAREQQITSGRGFVRVTTEFKQKSFDQQARVEAIENQFSVLFDPSARKYDRRDAEWCFVLSMWSKAEHERKYGKMTTAAKSGFFADSENPAPEWIGIGENGDYVQVAEYWLKEHKTRDLCILTDLSCVYWDEVPTNFDASRIMDTREEDCVTVWQYVIDGVGILSKTQFAVPFIPIVPVWGKQMMVKEKRRNYSLVRFAKDPQRLVNLYVSNIAEQIAMMPKAPYLAAVGAIEGLEDDWDDIIDDPKAVLSYNVVENAEKPERTVHEPPIQSLTIGLQQAIDAIKAAMGIYDAALGARSNETSGVAIQRRKKESDGANFHFPDNEARSRKTVGRILLALVAVLDKGSRKLATRKEDGKTHIVPVGQIYQHPTTGKETRHDLVAENFDLGVSTGPSHASQREEAFDVYSQIANADKDFMAKAGDILFENLDAPGSEKIAERYRKMLPAQLRPPDEEQNSQAQMQAAAQQLQVLGAQHEQLVAQVHELLQLVETKQLENESKERIEILKATVTLRIEAMRSGDKLKLAEADREAARLEAMFDRSHDAALATVAHSRAAAAQAAEHQQQQQLQPAAAEVSQ